MNIFKKIGLAFLVLFYLVAGLNHFISPGSYIAIIPHYLPWPHTLNIVAGCVEMLLASALLFKQIRTYAAFGIILMLLAFLPVHIAMIGETPLKLGNSTVTPMTAWLRLIVFQPLLMLWAWWYAKPKVNN